MTTLSRKRHLLSTGLGLAAASLALAAPAVAKAPSGTYKGTASNGKAVSLKVAGGEVRNLSIKKYTAKCKGASAIAGGFAFSPIDLSGRSFSKKGYTMSKLADGRDFVNNISVSGKFNKAGTKGKGTMRFDIEIADPAGVIKCSSGKLRYSVSK